MPKIRDLLAFINGGCDLGWRPGALRGSAQLGAGVFSGGLIFGIGDFGTITGGFYTVVAETLFLDTAP